MRDKLMDSIYFEEYILQQKQRMDKFSTKLSNGEVKEERKLPVMKKITDLKYSIFEAQYSKGDDLEILKSYFIEIIHDQLKFWDPVSGYLDMLEIMSIAILFEIDGEEWRALNSLIYNSEIDDWLLGYILNAREENDRYLGWEVRMKNPYQFLKKVIVESEKKEEDLKVYLEKYWYDGHKEMPWYEIHKAKEKLYSGYWSFEAGAIAKILNIDDSSLKETPYYPYDLVHYAK